MLFADRLRGQELSINTIIIAAIAIIALVVLIMMLTQKTSQFGAKTSDITGQKCVDVGVKANFGTDCEIIYGSFSDLSADEVCCRKP